MPTDFKSLSQPNLASLAADQQVVALSNTVVMEVTE